MAQTDAIFASLNAGEISRLALARIDLAKLRAACETQSNWLPHVLGPAMVRPGLGHIDGTAGNLAGWLGEFYFDENTKALLVLTTGAMTIMVNDAYVSRVSVATAVTNGDFNTDIAGWTDSDEAGATSSWAGGNMVLVGTGTNYAFRDQQVTVAGGDLNKEHALRLVVAHGYVSLAVGTAAGDGTYWDLQGLAPGSYSLAFTPPGDFWIRLGASTTYPSQVASINVEAAGIMSVPVPWSTQTDFDTLRYDQSGDVLFCACEGFQQRRIERRASNSRSWGVALYQADDGPFRLGNVSDSIQITPSGTSGAVTLTASRALFKSTQVGALFKLTHPSQTVTAALSVLNATTGNVRISGLASHSGSASARSFTVLVEGTFVATITLQRSIGAPGSWTNVESYTVPTSKTFDDGLDNQIIYYRLICSAYTSGTANSTLIYNSSSQTGIVRIGTFTNSTTVTADVLTELGGTTATSDWAEGEWSDYRGWPSAVALHDGRLGWFPAIKTQLSVSDGFASFDDTVTGDSGPINKTITTGGNDGARWALSLQRLIVGTAGQEVSIRASAFDEPLTPTAFVARDCSTRGAGKVRAIKIDMVGIFCERNAKRVFELAFDVQKGDYSSRELTRLKQEMCNAGIKDIAVQRQPDTRLWFVLADGTCAVLTYDLEDDVIAWTPATTNGSFERVAVLPGTDEDDVYFIVKRNISGDKRYVEKLAKRSECTGGTLSKTVDAHIVYTGAAVTTITGLSHLEGKQVVVWGDGAPQVTADVPKTVTGGQITGLPVAVSNAVVGLAYTAQLKTAKLAYGAEHGTALTMQKRVSRIGLVMADVAWKGVRVGRDFTNMTGLPVTYRGKALTAGQVLTAFDAVPGSFNGGWDADARVCIQVQSPYCATIMGLAIEMETNEPDDAPPKERAAA
jgi:hypothetical protein